MNASQTPYRLFAGVDIAATSFAASWTTGSAPHDRAVSFSQTADGFAAFHNRLLALGVPATQILVVLEATGTYWVMLATTLHRPSFMRSVVSVYPVVGSNS